jgi:hypothetical protein
VDHAGYIAGAVPIREKRGKSGFSKIGSMMSKNIIPLFGKKYRFCG